MSQASRKTLLPEAQAAKLRGILESAVTAIITIDDKGLIESINPATERLFGYGTTELMGDNRALTRQRTSTSWRQRGQLRAPAADS
jgi:PAS domain S-box-containing protein